jgi:hypothetical protein
MRPALPARPLQAYVVNCNWDTHPSLVCTPEVFAAQVAGLRALASAADMPADVSVSGTTAFVRDWAAPMPVLSAGTKVASESRARRQDRLLVCCEGGSRALRGWVPALPCRLACSVSVCLFLFPPLQLERSLASE